MEITLTHDFTLEEYEANDCLDYFAYEAINNEFESLHPGATVSRAQGGVVDNEDGTYTAELTITYEIEE